MKTLIFLFCLFCVGCTHLDASRSDDGRQYLTVDAWTMAIFYVPFMPNHGVQHVYDVAKDYARKRQKYILLAEFDKVFHNSIYGFGGYIHTRGRFTLMTQGEIGKFLKKEMDE